MSGDWVASNAFCKTLGLNPSDYERMRRCFKAYLIALEADMKEEKEEYVAVMELVSAAFSAGYAAGKKDKDK